MKPLALASVLVGSIVAFAVGAAAFWPMDGAAREALFEIPKGTFARRMAGNQLEILPSEIRLVLGVKDVLLLRNLDDVPQIFGPTLIMPGQSLRLPFETASEYLFVCSAHQSGQMTIIVEGGPAAHWSRVRIRRDRLLRTIAAFVRKESTS